MANRNSAEQYFAEKDANVRALIKGAEDGTFQSRIESLEVQIQSLKDNKDSAYLDYEQLMEARDAARTRGDRAAWEALDDQMRCENLYGKLLLLNLPAAEALLASGQFYATQRSSTVPANEQKPL